MEEEPLHLSFKPELIGRDAELERLIGLFQRSKEGRGSTVFVSGEAGIGKTRLVNELLTSAEDQGAKIIQGRCWTDSLEPLMPVIEGLREADLYHLISDEPPPKVLAAYLINEAGILVAKAEREDVGDETDPDIFSSMLKLVQDFVKDSLSMMGREEKGELNSIGYGDYNILIQSLEGISLAVVIEGSKSEFLIDDMKERLYGKAKELKDWDGDLDEVKETESEMEWFIESGKYEGEYIVDDPKIKQENLFDNVLLGLQRLSSERTVLLFLDDLHQADPSSLKLLHYLSRNTKDNKVMIVGTYRPEDIVERYDGEIHQLKKTLQEMNREGLFQEIRLKRLKETDVEDFMEDILGNIELKDEVVKKLYNECEGNPFFLLELLRNLVEENHIVKDEEEGVWRAEKALEEVHTPAKVYDLVVRRLDRLVEEQRELLECASVVGEEFQSEVLGVMTGMNRIKLLKNLNEMERTHNLIYSIKRKYRFDHSKIREVLYNGLNEELQREYHRMVASSYEELYDEDKEGVMDEIGLHYYKADDKEAGNYLLKAAESAKERYANDEAEMFYEYSIEMLEDEDKLKDAYEGLADIYKLKGEYDDSFEEYERALDLARDPNEKAGLYGKMAKIYEEESDYDKSLEICEKGLGLVEDLDDPEIIENELKLLGVKGWAFLRMGNYDGAEEAWRKSLKIAEEVGNDRERAHALHDIGTLYLRRGEYDKALTQLNEALQLKEEIGDEEGLGNSLNNLGVLYDYKGELDRGLEHYEESLEIWKKIGEKRGIGMALNNIGSAYRDKGEIDRSFENYQESLEISRKIGEKQSIAISLNNIGTAYRDKGDLKKSLEHHEKSLEISKMIGEKRGAAESLNNIAKVFWFQGEKEKCKRCLDESLEICFEIGSKQVSIENLCLLAEFYIGEEDHHLALQNAEKAVELSTEMGVRPKEGKSRRVLGMVYRKKGEPERADQEFKRAEKALRDSGRKIDQPKVIYEHALLFKDLDEQKRAEGYLTDALEAFDERGMMLWVDRCKKALKEL